MKTASPYEPALKYEPSFYKKEKTNKQKIYVVQVNGPTLSRYFWTIEGDTVEELLFNVINFKSLQMDIVIRTDVVPS